VTTHKPCLSTVLSTDVDRGEQVIALKGKLLGTAECYEFLDDTRERIRDGFVRVVLDMSHVELINSTGVGILAAVLTSVRRQEGSLALVGLPERARQVLEFMRLHEFAHFCDSLAAARAAAA